MDKVVYALFLDEKFKALCATFDIAAALALENIATTPAMRIECATAPAALQKWIYDYSERAWVETI